MQIETGALTVALLRDLTFSGGTGMALAMLYEMRREIEQQTAVALESIGAYWQEDGGVTMRGVTLPEFAKHQLTVTLSFAQLQALLLAYYGDAQTPAKVWPQQIGLEALDVARELGPQLQAWAEEARAIESWERLPASVKDKAR